MQRHRRYGELARLIGYDSAAKLPLFATGGAGAWVKVTDAAYSIVTLFSGKTIHGYQAVIEGWVAATRTLPCSRPAATSI